jgi:hypothetical protein
VLLMFLVFFTVVAGKLPQTTRRVLFMAAVVVLEGALAVNQYLVAMVALILLVVFPVAVVAVRIPETQTVQQVVLVASLLHRGNWRTTWH